MSSLKSSKHSRFLHSLFLLKAVSQSPQSGSDWRFKEGQQLLRRPRSSWQSIGDEARLRAAWPHASVAAKMALKGTTKNSSAS